MSVNIWFFLSVFVVFGLLFAMYVMYLNHTKTMKQLEIEALKVENKKSQDETRTP